MITEQQNFLNDFTDEKLSPTADFTFLKGRRKDPVRVRLYGKFRGERFEKKHIRQIERILCVHGADHSVAMFLNEKDCADAAIYNEVAFSFPQQLEYVKYFTQRYSYPLIVTSDLVPVEARLKQNGVHTMFRRWCSRIYKIEIPRAFYRKFNLNGITQVKGITQHQSSKRSKMDPDKILDPMSQKTLKIFQELPIFNMKPSEEKDIMRLFGIKENPNCRKFGIHGCLMCPFRTEAYFKKLKNDFPELYKKCQQWRRWGSYKSTKGGGSGYYYFRKSKIM